MTFPIWWEGDILFRFGKPAMDLRCCCGVCLQTWPIFHITVEWAEADAPNPVPSLRDFYNDYPFGVAQVAKTVSDCVSTAGVIVADFWIVVCMEQVDGKDDNVVYSEVEQAMSAEFEPPGNITATSIIGSIKSGDYTPNVTFPYGSDTTPPIDQSPYPFGFGPNDEACQDGIWLERTIYSPEELKELFLFECCDD